MLPKKKSKKVDSETGISYEVVEEDGEECDELEEEEDYLLTVSITCCIKVKLHDFVEYKQTSLTQNLR